MKNRPTFSLSLGILWAFFQVFGCHNSAKSDYFGTILPKHPSNELWISNGAEAQHADPHKATGVQDNELIRNMFARLVMSDPETGQIVGDLAERWDISEDGTEYTFHLRPGLTWSDGVPITAHTVEWSWKRLLSPQTAAEYANLAFEIVNAEAYALGAIHLKYLKSEWSPEKLQAALEAIAPIKRIERSGVSGEAFVYLGGKSDETRALREKLITQINKSKVLGQNAKASIANENAVAIRALDKQRFWVKLKAPLPYFLTLIEFNAFAPTPRHVIEKVSAREGSASLWVRPENIATSGPYVLKEEAFRQYKIYEKNPNYWNADQVQIKRVKVFIIESQNANLFQYRSGEIDWTGAPVDVPAEYVDRLEHLKDFYADPYLGIYFFGFNVTKKPFDNPKVRRALSLAIDRASIAKSMGGGKVPYASMVPDGLAGYKGLKQKLYDPAEAKRLLSEAGYPNGQGFVKSNGNAPELLYNTQEQNRMIAQIVQQMWKKNLNVKVQLVNREWKVYLSDMKKLNFDIVRRSWIGDFLDPYTFLEIMLSNSGNNRTGWKSEEYDQKIRQANAQINPQERLRRLRKAEAFALKQQAMAPIYVYTKVYFKKPYLKGFYPDYKNLHSWQHMWIDPNWNESKISEPHSH